MSRLLVSSVVLASAIAVMTPVSAHAITNDKLAYLTFSAPVQVPGAVLQPGTYRFRLVDLETSRKVLQVLSNDGSVVYSMFHTRPDSRTSLTPDPVVSFRETPAGVPIAVKSLFYGHEYLGYEFVYPKGGPIMVAEEWSQPPITYSAAPAAPATEAIVEREAAVAERGQAPVLEQAPAPVQQPAAPPAELPRTASPLPLVAAGGVTSLLAGLGLKLLRRRG